MRPIGLVLSLFKCPVASGAAIPISDNEAPLSVHGSAAAIRNSCRYHQEKRCTPAPR